MTSRPEFRPSWANHSHFTYLTVNRVTRRQTELMVERLTGRKPLPAEVLQQVVAKTDGVPLFVEELTRKVLESGLLRAEGDRYELTRALAPLAIPSTLQDSLMARPPDPHAGATLEPWAQPRTDRHPAQNLRTIVRPHWATMSRNRSTTRQTASMGTPSSPM